MSWYLVTYGYDGEVLETYVEAEEVEIRTVNSYGVRRLEAKKQGDNTDPALVLTVGSDSVLSYEEVEEP